ncbi:hypothetical protein BST61_g5690 [Cercospora zeina]
MSTITPHKRKLCDFSEQTVTILVGPTLKSFTVHPTMITNHSRFFRAMFNTSNAFQEAREKLARLPEVDAGIFQIYVTYVYSGNIFITKNGGEEEHTNDNDPDATMRFQVLVQLYALANYLQDINLKNKIIDYLLGAQSLLVHGATPTSISLAFETSPETHSSSSSTLCRLLTDTYLSSCNPKFLEESWNDLPMVFLGSLALGWAKATWDKETVYDHPSAAARCEYHEHDEEVLVEESGSCGIVPAVVGKAMPKKKEVVRLPPRVG